MTFRGICFLWTIYLCVFALYNSISCSKTTTNYANLMISSIDTISSKSLTTKIQTNAVLTSNHGTVTPITSSVTEPTFKSTVAIKKNLADYRTSRGTKILKSGTVTGYSLKTTTPVPPYLNLSGTSIKNSITMTTIINGNTIDTDKLMAKRNAIFTDGTQYTTMAPMTSVNVTKKNSSVSSTTLDDSTRYITTKPVEAETITRYRGLKTGYMELSLDIASSYEKSVRPKCVTQEITHVTIDMAIRQLINIDEPKQTLEMSVWMRMIWIDCNLVWEPADYNDTQIMVRKVIAFWKPDITVYESITEEFHGFNDFRAKICYDGSVHYNFPSRLKTLCQLDVSRFPFDVQTCSLTFGSWACNGLELDVTSKSNIVDISAVEENAEWEIVESPIVRHEIIYGCCPEPYPDVTFYINLRRKPTHYVINIIIPSILITCVAGLGFILPVDAGEKIGLQLTVMLTISVFQMLVAEKLPPAADSQPRISIFLSFTLILSGGSILMQVLVLNVYFRGQQEMPPFVKYYILKPLSVILFVPIQGLKNYLFKSTPDSQLTKLFYGLAEQRSDNILKEPENPKLWIHLAVVLDRLGFCVFTISLVTAATYVFCVIK